MSHAGALLRFLLVGGTATAMQYAVLVALVRWAGVGPTLASCIGFVLSAVLNYALNRRFTFRSQARHAQALPRFAAKRLSRAVESTVCREWLPSRRTRPAAGPAPRRRLRLCECPLDQGASQAWCRIPRAQAIYGPYGFEC